MVWRKVGAALAGLVLLAVPATAADYISFSKDKVFLRQGPSFDHRILWVYHRKGLPVEVVNKYAAWRRVKDSDGTLGWVHTSMLSDNRTVVFVSSTPSTIRTDPSDAAKPIALAAQGVVAKLKSCKPQFCQVEVQGIEGWADKKNIWGVDAGESFR
ncbi:MAG TPA: SH3 domain-containing protein [Rhizomicrobium sp.]|jgi:SH3-like domain-containing protein|nr:SH3 domain-containing protein [Rhizomicrobium sp.]